GKSLRRLTVATTSAPPRPRVPPRSTGPHAIEASPLRTQERRSQGVGVSQFLPGLALHRFGPVGCTVRRAKEMVMSSQLTPRSTAPAKTAFRTTIDDVHIAGASVPVSEAGAAAMPPL